MKSVMQSNRLCWFCGSPYVELHHVRLNNHSRKMAEKYGMVCWLCRKHHKRLHEDIVMKTMLQQYAQLQFESRHSHEEYMEIFGKDYFEETDDVRGE